jgi:hypothetical protein
MNSEGEFSYKDDTTTSFSNNKDKLEYYLNFLKYLNAKNIETTIQSQKKSEETVVMNNEKSYDSLIIELINNLEKSNNERIKYLEEKTNKINKNIIELNEHKKQIEYLESELKNFKEEYILLKENVDKKILNEKKWKITRKILEGIILFFNFLLIILFIYAYSQMYIILIRDVYKVIDLINEDKSNLQLRWRITVDIVLILLPSILSLGTLWIIPKFLKKLVNLLKEV